MGVSMLFIVLFVTTLFVAYTNGANDNFKGVATLYGSGTIDYRTAIALATLATFAGSVCALLVAQGLVESFSGKGLVPQDTAGSVNFLIAVGLGAALTVLLATRLGIPISTTHSLVGGLLGAGLMAVGAEVNFSRLGGAFLLPLLVSPFIALILAALLYRLFSHLRRRWNITKETCFCVGERREFVPVSALPAEAMTDVSMSDMALTVADNRECQQLYTDRVWGFQLQKILNLGHIFSGATVSFARGLNDTPKIAGLLVAAQALDVRWGMVAIAMAMAVGGLLHARRVAETISHKITEIQHGQGFSANLVTSFLVIFASKWGVPVSTTHVSVGSIIGIGTVTGRRNNTMIGGILMSWLVTLPMAMVLSALGYNAVSLLF